LYWAPCDVATAEGQPVSLLTFSVPAAAEAQLRPAVLVWVAWRN